MKPPFTDAEALAWSGEHLLYEFTMLYDTRSLGGSSAPGGYLKNAVIESFAIHLRNWIDFFFPANPRPDDVTFRDFLPTDSAWVPTVAMSWSLQDARERANKEIAHMTAQRYAGADPRKWWDPMWAREVADLMLDFAKHASPARVAPEVLDLLAHA
jgi:hypothetical protein